MERDIFLKSLGKSVQRHRKALGVSQEAFAMNIGLDRSYYGHLEQGKINISIYKLYSLVDDLGISLEELWKDI